MDGYNATIFAYGQTSSGKTYTMEGASIDDPTLRGIIPRTATEIFNNVMAADENMEFIVKVSYIEIYMERIRDLLDPYKSKVNLQVREDAQRGIFVEGMTEVCVTSDEELLCAMKDGAANRAVAATGMNEGSSRSHSVFMVTLYQRNLENQATKAGKMYLVDLAGSEMVRKTGASGKQLEEAKTINKSLSALGMVINALTDSNASHIPYRDSKLTRVLQESLGGNSRTALVINVSPSSYNAPETLSTLRFGNRAKSIKNKAVVNEQRSVEEYKLLLAKMEKAMAAQKNYILSLEARLSGDESGGKLDGADDEKSAAGNEKVDSSDVNITFDSSAAKSAAAKALEELQEKVTRLEDELAEEKLESSRRGEEIRILTVKVEEQADALKLGQQLNEELQSVKELQAKTLEERLRQQETVMAELSADFERLSFQHQELVIHTETVQREYDALLRELPTTMGAPSPSKLATAAIALEKAEQEKAEQEQAHTEAQAADGASTTPDVPSEVAEDAVAQASEAEDADAIPSGESSTESVNLKAKCTSLETQLKEYEKDYRLLQVTSERERERLQEDIERKRVRIHDLETQLDQSSTASTTSSGASSPGGGSSGMSARERQHMRSIQQKLEQLVAVHRQLLRKYASLELELSEAKKKLVLRDERIKQVEGSNRIMAANMRAQAEKHVEELTHLRDQIADFRGAQRSHFEAQMSHNNADSVIKTLRGGSIAITDNVIRPIRGGGKRKTMAMNGPPGAYPGANGANGEMAPSSFLNRLFGK